MNEKDECGVCHLPVAACVCEEEHLNAALNELLANEITPDQPTDEDVTKEARELSPEKASRKLYKLVQESPTFEDFKTKLAGNRWWYLGDPMPEPFRTWTWADFQNFYLTNKS